MANSLESTRQETEDRTSFVWNFTTGPSPWSSESPKFFLHDNRQCNLQIEGTYTNNCVSRVEYKVKLKLVFNNDDTCYFNESFEAKIRQHRKEYKFKLAKVTDQEFSDEILIHHNVSLSKQNLQLHVELVCRTLHNHDKVYSRLPFDNNIAGLSHDLQYLLDYGYRSDLDIEVAGRVFKAHGAIVGCRSNVLAKMIEHDMLERRTGRIVLWDWEPEVVRRALTYIYTGKYELSRDTAHELFRLAHYLELIDLQVQTKLYILVNLSVDNIAETLRLTYHDQYDMDDVWNEALKFISANEAQCAANADLLEYFSRSLDIKSVGFVLKFANRQNLEKTLLTVMRFIRRNFQKVMANHEITSYLVSEPHLMSRIVQPEDSNANNNNHERVLGASPKI